MSIYYLWLHYTWVMYHHLLDNCMSAADVGRLTIKTHQIQANPQATTHKHILNYRLTFTARVKRLLTVRLMVNRSRGVIFGPLYGQDDVMSFSDWWRMRALSRRGQDGSSCSLVT